MNEAEWQGSDQISPGGLAAILLRYRWKISLWAILGALVVLPTVIGTASLFRASASFLPQGYDGARSGLASLAGQFGVSVPGTTQSLSPEFYSKLVTSRVILAPIARDTFTVQELGGKRVPFLELFRVSGDTPAKRDERAVATLSQMVTPSIAK